MTFSFATVNSKLENEKKKKGKENPENKSDLAMNELYLTNVPTNVILMLSARFIRFPTYLFRVCV